MSDLQRRYIVSSLVTFFSAFLLSVGSQLAVGNMDVSTLTWSAVVSVILTAVRAALKVLVEFFNK